MKDKELRRYFGDFREETEADLRLTKQILLELQKENMSVWEKYHERRISETMLEAGVLGLGKRMDLLMDYLDVETQDYARKLVKRKKSTPPKNT